MLSKLQILGLLMLVPFFSFGQFGNPAEDTIDVGVTLFEKEAYTEAYVKFKQALKMDKTNFRAMFEMANTSLAMDNYKQCVKWSNKIIKAQNPNYMMDAFMLKADSYEKQGDRTSAIKIYEEAVALYNRSSYLHRKLALRYMKMGELSKAQESIEKTLFIDEDNADNHKILANILLKKGEFVHATFATLKALHLNPSDKDGLALLAVLKDDLSKDLKGTKDSVVQFRGDWNDLVKVEGILALAKKLEAFVLGCSSNYVSEDHNLYVHFYLDGYTKLFQQGYGKCLAYLLYSKIDMAKASAWISDPKNAHEYKLFEKWYSKNPWIDLKL